MKTPMQELIEEIKEKQKEYNPKSSAYNVLRHLEARLYGEYLEKEKQVIINAYQNCLNRTLNETQNPMWTAEEYYNETFNQD